MDPLWRPTNGDDEERLSEFLTRMFSANAGLVSSSMLRWKYWTPREDWPEPRSFWMERDGRVIAHVGLWPVTVRTGRRASAEFTRWIGQRTLTRAERAGPRLRI
jgi:hypothetical protein